MITIQMTPNRMAVLKALARYYFLIPEQFVRLGITTDRSNLSKRVLGPLSGHKPAMIQTANVGPSKPYCLTAFGARFATDELGFFRSSVSGRWSAVCPDFWHRTSTIDFLIELDAWAAASGLPVEFYNAYYQGDGSRSKLKFTALTRHEFADGAPFVPDLELRMTCPDGAKRLFAVEFHNGRSVKEIIDQLELHLRAISEGVLSTAHDHEFANFVLSVYQHASTIKGVKERLDRYPLFAEFKPLFLFNTLDQLRIDFGAGWTDFSGDAARVFSVP